MIRVRSNSVVTLVAALLLMIFTRTLSAEKMVRCTETRKMMGTYVRIICYADTEAAGQAAMAGAFDHASKQNQIFSTYEPDSEVSQLNRAFAQEVVDPVKVSQAFMELLILSKRHHQASAHVFDPTVGPAVHLWRWSRYHRKLPPEKEFEQARTLIGLDKIKVDVDAGTIQYQKPGMTLDFGGIAKGYIVDLMIRFLHDRGIRSALVDAGGDLKCSQSPPGRGGWRVSLMPFPLRKQDAKSIKPIVMEVSDCAVATSGDAYRYIEIEGKRYSHIVDPRTGLGMTRRMGVSVVVKQSRSHIRAAADADALATSFTLLGPEVFQSKEMNRLKMLEGVSSVFMWMDEETDQIKRLRKPAENK